MKTLVLGKGEVGKALSTVLSENYREVITLDENEDTKEKFDIIHICFPYFEGFIKEVKRYQKKYLLKGGYTVIHSTTPVGTSKKCNAVHSPIVGIHPRLENSIKTFVKFLGGEKASEVANYFRKAGIKIYITDKSETTELAKIASTTFYSLMIEYVKDLKRQCDKNNVPFSEVYTLWTQEYNSGYQKLGYPEYTRPLLVPIMKKIDGHCCLGNCELWDTVFTKLIKKLNKDD